MSLSNAIEDLYEAFADIEMPRGIDGCPCCMAEDEYKTLTAKPLSELSAEELNEYASGALLTMGSEDDYPYFLPRIIELTIEEGPEWLASAEITAQKLQMAGFQQWGEQKQTAINNTWLAVIRELAASENDPELLGFISSDIDTWLCAATLIPIPVTPLTDFLDEWPDVIRAIYNINFKTLFQGRMANPFLEEPSDGQAEIAAWLRDRVEKTMK